MRAVLNCNTVRDKRRTAVDFSETPIVAFVPFFAPFFAQNFYFVQFNVHDPKITTVALSPATFFVSCRSLSMDLIWVLKKSGGTITMGLGDEYE